ncbi:MAG TPA: hypothetical protein VGH14_03040 [Solirubrobacterales bacterium]|jgi:predicted transcriptional regulator
MSTAEVVRAVGGALEGVAEGGAEDAYRRSQVLSALSVCRLLSAEEDARAELNAWLEEATAPILAALGEKALVVAPADAAGERLSALMDDLRAADDEESRRALRELRRVLHELCDREIAALATAA